ncbi:MAG: S9 family peptidase [Fidelibacterota bacterium]
MVVFAQQSNTSGKEAKMPQPPITKQIPHDITVHGDHRIDPYYWLRNREDPVVMEYLEAENAYTEQVMKHTEAFQEQLYQEIKSRIKETDLSVPVKIDDYYYYTRTEEGKQYPIHCRKFGSLEAPEEIILDENALAAGYTYFRLGAFAVSPNHQLLAYSVDTTGAEKYRLFVLDLSQNRLLSDVIDNTYTSVEWANDNQTLFYNILDAAHRPYQVFRHRLGTSAKEDPLVYHEKDERFYLDISKSKSKKYLFLNLESEITSEIRFLAADNPEGEFKIFHPRQQGMEYSVAHRGDQFYVLTNDNALNFKLMITPVAQTSKDNWTEVIPHRKGVKIDYMDIFQDYLVVYERENGLRKIRITDLNAQKTHYVTFPEEVYTLWGGPNPDYHSKLLRFTYTSLVTPKSVYDYDMQSHERVLKKQDEVLGGYDHSLYVTKRLWATTEDATPIPMSMVYRKGMERNGKNNLYLYGYGSYGATIDPYFSSVRLSLLDRGFIYVIAHVRGGGYLGRGWYEDGKFLHKRNTFTDFIACAEYLIQENYTNPDQLVIAGGSAGGLLMGAVTNMRPDLFKVVVAQVPFVDVVNTMLDETIPLTVIEFEEWGNPKEKKFYDYMLSYSPYDNVTTQDYPNMLITTSLNDPRVAYWEPAKWTAKLRALKTDQNRLLLKINMNAGHGGASGRYEYLKEIAFNYTFIFDVLGLLDQ